MTPYRDPKDCEIENLKKELDQYKEVAKSNSKQLSKLISASQLFDVSSIQRNEEKGRWYIGISEFPEIQFSVPDARIREIRIGSKIRLVVFLEEE